MEVTRCDTCGKECSSDQVVELRDMKLCATCKQDAVRDIKSGALPEFCPPTTVEAIRREIRLHRRLGTGLVGGGIALIMLILPLGMAGKNSQPIPFFIGAQFFGHLVFFIGVAFTASRKGRNTNWAFLSLLLCVGLVILFFMGKICRYCSAQHPFSREECNICHAPL